MTELVPVRNAGVFYDEDSMSRSVRVFREHQVVTRAYASSFWETRDGAFLYLQGECSVPELPDWTETERVRQQEKERFVRIAGLHIKTNTGGRNEYPQKITEKE